MNLSTAQHIFYDLEWGLSREKFFSIIAKLTKQLIEAKRKMNFGWLPEMIPAKMGPMIPAKAEND